MRHGPVRLAIVQPELGGTRLEDPFVVTATGIELLSVGLPTRIWEAT
jgi:Xaa-Pro aminopeptidase